MQETDQIFHRWYAAHQTGQRSVLATIVATEGSSYRKPGARMLVTEDGQIAGAVSGGCVERAVAQQAQVVFTSGEPTMMEYDGRYRLGCNGTLFILLEPMQPANPEAFWQSYQRSYYRRQSFTIATTYRGAVSGQGSLVVFSRQNLYYVNGQALSDERVTPSQLSGALTDTGASTRVFVQVVMPAPQLWVIGSEADAVKLAQLANALDWSVQLITHPHNPVTANGLTSAAVAPEALLNQLTVDAQTAVVLMTHSYSRDLAYLLALLRAERPAYLGLLGPSQRRDSLFNDILEHSGELPAWLDNQLYAPAGIDLGAELPAEVALSVLAEIKAVLASRPVPSLRSKPGTIHQTVASVL